MLDVPLLLAAESLPPESLVEDVPEPDDEPLEPEDPVLDVPALEPLPVSEAVVAAACFDDSWPVEAVEVPLPADFDSALLSLR